MMKHNSKLNYYLKYTVAFTVFIVAVYGYFFLYRKSFVNLGQAFGDGLVQHYNALCYYAKWMRGIIRTLLSEHKLVIPEWSFCIGYGSDILSTLHYYVMGDPFNLLAVAVPVKFMEYYYGLMVIGRMYCAGIACSEFCVYFSDRKEWDNGILAGALTYVFCAYGVYAGINHPYFINPMIYCPLLLLGAEKVIRKENPVLFVFSVFVSAVSNFYFFYMLVIVTVVFVAARLGYKCRAGKDRFGWKAALASFMRVGVCSIVGLGCSAVIFLPVILSVFGDTRFAAKTYFDVLYPLNYYEKLPASMLTFTGAGYWSYLGISCVGFLALVLVFAGRSKRCRGLKPAAFLLTIVLFIPAAASVLNAFSYPSNRWVWAYTLFVAFLVAVFWPYMLEMPAVDKRRSGMVILAYFLVCLLLDNSRTENLAYSMGCVALTFCVSQIEFGERRKTIRYREALLLLLLLVNTAVNGYFHFSVKESNSLKKYVDRGEVEEFCFRTQDLAVAAAAQEEDDFYRYTHFAANNNSTLNSGLHSLQYYWSLSNPEIVAANEMLGILGRTHNNYLDLNNRAGLTDLANVRYFVDLAERGAHYAPYGFEYVGTYSIDAPRMDKWDVYRNGYFLPFGYTYGAVLDQPEFEALSSVQKEEAMLQGVLLESGKEESVQEQAGLPVADLSFSEQEINYDMVCGDSVVCQESSFVATKKKTTVTLNIAGLPDCETYLVVEGLDYRACSPIDLYKEEYSEFDPLDQFTEREWENKGTMGQISERYKNRNWSQPSELEILVSGTDQDGRTVTQQLYHFTPDYTWYSGKEDYTVNLGYSASAKTSISLVLPEAGIYSYKTLRVVCRPMAGFADAIRTLGEETMEEVAFEPDCVTGKITVSSDKVLCTTIPYWKGWTAYVDGEKADILKANLMYSGLALPAGSHTIVFVYKTPGLRLGILISMLSLLSAAAVVFRYLHSRKNMVKS